MKASELYYGIDKSDWKAVSFKGGIYGIPWKFPKTERRCFIIRDDLRIKYNLPEPKTIEDFELYLKTIKENETIMPFIYGSDGVLNDF